MAKNKQGFTLIELLVVIAIIGLLSTLSIVALNNARARSRDARRVSDVKQVQTALELYYSDNGSYPGGNVFASSSITNGTVTYMTTIPTPPTPADATACSGTTAYTYAMQSSGQSYTIVYCIGQAITGGPASGLNTATPAGIK